MFKRISIKDLYIQLIVVNLVIFLFANITASFGSSFFIEWFALPLEGNIISRFWTIITAHFLHVSFGHIFNNMIIILLFGRLVQYFFNKQSILSIYIVTAIFSSIIILIFTKILGFSGYAFGASCASYAIMMSVVIYKPNFSINIFILGAVKIKWIAIVLILLGVIINFGNNLGGNIGHISGILVGCYFGYRAKYGTNIFYVFDRFFKRFNIGENNVTKARRQTKKREYYYKSELDMDKILDKILKEGLNSLTEEEKNFIKK